MINFIKMVLPKRCILAQIIGRA